MKIAHQFIGGIEWSFFHESVKRTDDLLYSFVRSADS